jgi:hypothetical protein
MKNDGTRPHNIIMRGGDQGEQQFEMVEKGDQSERQYYMRERGDQVEWQYEMEEVLRTNG